MKLPDYPVSTEPVRAIWGRQIVDYLRSITLCSGVDIFPEASANGTTLRLKAVNRDLRHVYFRCDSSVLFGYSQSGSVFTVHPGEVQFRDMVYESALTNLTIAATDTYIYLEMEWGTGACSIKQSTNKADATSSSTAFRKWLYLVGWDSTHGRCYVKTYGHTGGAISIVPVFG